MFKLRFIIPILLCVILAIPVRAEHLPEVGILDRELIIENDSNVIKENLDKDNETPSKEDENIDYKVIFMSEKEYFKLIILPSILLFALGITAFTVSVFIEIKKQKLK